MKKNKPTIELAGDHQQRSHHGPSSVSNGSSIFKSPLLSTPMKDWKNGNSKDGEIQTDTETTFSTNNGVTTQMRVCSVQSSTCIFNAVINRPCVRSISPVKKEWLKKAKTKCVNDINKPKKVVSTSKLCQEMGRLSLKDKKSNKGKSTGKLSKLPVSWSKTFQWHLAGFHNFSILKSTLARLNITDMNEEGDHSRKSKNDTRSLAVFAENLGISISDVKNLNFSNLFQDCVEYSDVAYNLHNPYSVELIKFNSLQYWQKDEIMEFAYQLQRAHGVGYRCDILDKRNLYLSRHEEYKRLYATKALDPKEEDYKTQVFTVQINEIFNFGSNEKAFWSEISELDQGWHIVQVSSLLDTTNRFKEAVTKKRKTLPIFLTAFGTLDTKSRFPYVAYLEEPKFDEGSTMHQGIIVELEDIVEKNRKVSSSFKSLNRNDYWAERSRHNERLKTVVSAMEDSWIAPWDFLFPGNLTDIVLRRKLISELSQVEACISRKLSVHEKIAMYKLMENYHSLMNSTKTALEELIQIILNFDDTKRAFQIVNIVESASESVSVNARRHPTILIVDQELEFLPWECLKCLQTTPVTRMPSLASILCTVKTGKFIHSKFPAVVQPRNCAYMLNPDSSLKNVQERLESYYASQESWKGIVGTVPSSEDVKEIVEKRDVLLYCGHGNGSLYVAEHMLQKVVCRTVPLLMGCASAHLKYVCPKSFGVSHALAYLMAGCTSVVGYLWEVTDVDCDRVTVDLVERWLPVCGALPKMPNFNSKKDRPKETSLAEAVRLSRNAANNFLTAAALVNYGVPIDSIS